MAEEDLRSSDSATRFIANFTYVPYVAKSKDSPPLVIKTLNNEFKISFRYPDSKFLYVACGRYDSDVEARKKALAVWLEVNTDREIGFAQRVMDNKVVTEQNMTDKIWKS
tara:strand:- start:790 stop:1119 length:330 start_codon:yes stop_codon:yes gene_type:complete